MFSGWIRQFWLPLYFFLQDNIFFGKILDPGWPQQVSPNGLIQPFFIFFWNLAFWQPTYFAKSTETPYLKKRVGFVIRSEKIWCCFQNILIRVLIDVLIRQALKKIHFRISISFFEPITHFKFTIISINILWTIGPDMIM